MSTRALRLGAAALAVIPFGWLPVPAQAVSGPLYRLGSRGPAVAIYQQELLDLGYHPGLTGTYTRATQSAVKTFQHWHRLHVDGIIGPNTDARLQQVLGQTFHKTPGALGTRTLAAGDYGISIATLQRHLRTLGDYKGAPDGVYNRFTVAAVRAFQVHTGRAVTGIGDVATLHALRQAWLAQTSKPAPSSPHVSTSSAGPMVLGYYVPGSAAWNDLVAHAGQITAIAPFWYSFRPSDSLHNLGPNEAFVTQWAHHHHIAVYPMIINGYGNDHMLQNRTLLKQDVATLVKLAQTDGYDGWNVDFESLNNVDETGLDTFVADLARRLHQEGKKLIVSVGPRTSATNGYHVYNYAALSTAADYIDLMLYDAHDNGGSPGPVAPLGWTANIVHYAEATIPRSKILVGLAGYGYNWASTGSTEINDGQALALAKQYGYTWVGGTTQEPKVTYRVGSVSHTVWFEDSYSEAFKAAWVKRDRLGGIALWDLGEEDSGVWPMLKKQLP